jgi:hypothetical protein
MFLTERLYPAILLLRRSKGKVYDVTLLTLLYLTLQTPNMMAGDWTFCVLKKGG